MVHNNTAFNQMIKPNGEACYLCEVKAGVFYSIPAMPSTILDVLLDNLNFDVEVGDIVQKLWGGNAIVDSHYKNKVGVYLVTIRKFLKDGKYPYEVLTKTNNIKLISL